jgi:hypothetical protein
MYMESAVTMPRLSQPDQAFFGSSITTFTARLPNSLGFTSPIGALLRDGNFRRWVWRPSLTKG